MHQQFILYKSEGESRTAQLQDEATKHVYGLN